VLAAAFRNYNFTTCRDTACWDSQVAPVAAQVPLVTGEIGEDDGAVTYINAYMGWADPRGISYLAWTWDTWGCANGPVLISDYSGTACPGYGAGYRAHLAAARLRGARALG
jgi:endoglucanase